MKTRILLFIGMLLITFSNVSSQETGSKNNVTQKGAINVLSSPDLYNLTTKWAGEYERLNPKVSIIVKMGSDAGIAGMLKAGTGIGIISQGSDPAHHIESAWNIVIGRDMIVPVINAKNPFLDEINQIGISPEAFIRIIESRENLTWGSLLGNGQNIPVHCYMVNDASVKSGVADFVKVNPDVVSMMTVETGAELVAAIRKDPDAIGFCRMVSILDANNQTLAENIRLLPIDKNGNGKIDYMEKIYDNLQTFSRGVWIGKYPKALSGNIYAVSAVQPNNENESAFLTWVLTDGQKFLNQQGFSDLVASERQTQLDKLINIPETALASSYNRVDILKLVLLIIIAIAVIGFIADMVIRSMRNKITALPDSGSAQVHAFDEESVIIPKGLYFDKTHTWAFMEKDGSVKVGIDDFLQRITGALTRIEMKKPGEKIKKGDQLLTIIRNGKQLHLYAPVSGTITAQNTTLITNSSMLNTAPYSDGWVYMIEPANWLREIQFLTMAEKYKAWLKDEFSRLKDFFAAALTAQTPEYAYVAMQDGGEMMNNILADLGPKVWEDFQTKFIDTAR